MSDVKVFHLDKYRMAWQDYVARKKRLREDKKFVDEAGDLLKELANEAKELRLGGEKVAMVVAGQLNATRLAAEQPEVIEKYTRVVTERKFDARAFQADEPELFAQYQAQRLVLAPGVLPGDSD